MNIRRPYRRATVGTKLLNNIRFTDRLLFTLSCCVAAWLLLVLLRSGDVHPNPGPNDSNSSVASDSTASYSTLSYCTESSASLLESVLHYNLSLVHYNVQSIKAKLDVIYAELKGFDILTFSETWLSDGTPTSDLHLQNFQSPERKDRPNDNHGGVVVYVKESIPYSRRLDLELNGLECIWIELKLKHKKLLLGTFYRPPNALAVYTSLIEDSISLAMNSGIKDVIVTGDLNYNCLNPLSSSARTIHSFCQEFGLVQTVEEPTHFTENSHSLIDLILVSNKDFVFRTGVAEPFLDQPVRYHCPIYGLFKFSKPKAKTYSRTVWKYDQGDYDQLRQDIKDTNWDLVKHDDVNKYAYGVSKAILDIAKVCIPNKVVLIRPNDPPWLTNEIKKHIRIRKRAYKKAKRTNLLTDWNKFKKIRNKVILLIRHTKQQHYDSLCNKLKSASLTPRDWWKTLKSFLPNTEKVSVPALKHQGQLFSDNEEKAQILNDFFASQSSLNDTDSELPDMPMRNPDNVLDPRPFTSDEVATILVSLQGTKAPGPDQINNRVLSQISKEISPTLCDLYNSCIASDVFPSTWKEANVTAVFKKGDSSLSTNYRPISLLNVLGKVFEKLLYKQIFNYLADTDFLSPFQSGFLPGDSTVNQLTYLYNAFCQAVDSGKEVQVIFFDISKAFDRVWHKGLLVKLRAAGLSPKFTSLLSSYLSDRKQCVVLPGAKSNWRSITAGVPQGSMLGPLLFLVYINDIVTEISSNIRLFADDTSLYLTINRRDQVVLANETLNSDISKISKWAQDWLVTFNPNKSESMLISRKQNTNVFPPLVMDNQAISDVENHKHLGLFLSDDCSWHSHIDYIKSKAWSKIHLMRKLMYQLDRRALETIYLSFIRPLLEYSDVVWDNCTIYEKDELDKIQNEAARICSGATKLISLNKLSAEIGWESLQSRRSKHKLIMYYKMTHGLSPTYLSELVPPPVSVNSRYNLRNTQNLQVPFCRTNLYFNFFLPSATRAWNALPDEVKSATSVMSFKYHLNMDKVHTPSHYYSGKRKLQVLHTRLRTNCSSLNDDLFSRGITDSAICHCGKVENVYHFFFDCPSYSTSRTKLFNSVSQVCPLSLKILLSGDDSLSPASNVKVFNAVQTFIEESKRFI